MNNKFKRLNGNQNISSNKNFSVYNGNNDISEAMKIAEKLKKESIKKDDNVKNLDSNKAQEKNEVKEVPHQTFELSDDELKKRIKIAKNRNFIALQTLNESSTLDEILSGVIDDLMNNIKP